MDAFVKKVRSSSAATPMRVVSLRSLDSVKVLSLRSGHRHLTRQRDDLLKRLGAALLDLLIRSDGHLEGAELQPGFAEIRARYEEGLALESQLRECEQRLGYLERVQKASEQAPFLTVCSCGAPLFPQDSKCGVCGHDVEDLIRLAVESKSHVPTVPCECGVALPGGIRFCPQCGRNVSALLQEQGMSTGDAARCPRCGEGATPGDRFCSGCGHTLDAG